MEEEEADGEVAPGLQRLGRGHPSGSRGEEWQRWFGPVLKQAAHRFERAGGLGVF